MRFLQSWGFVNGGALAVTLALAILSPLPPKVSADGGLYSYSGTVAICGAAWLILAIVRFVAISRERSS